MRGGHLWAIGLIPLLAVALLLLGAWMGTVPFNQLPGVGWALAGGALLMALGILVQWPVRRWLALAVLLPLGIVEGAAAWWTIRAPEEPGAALVRLRPARMGALLADYVDIHAGTPPVEALVAELVDHAPYEQVFYFHHRHRERSVALGLPDACVTRLSGESPDVILAQLEGAYDAFGYADGTLAPLAAMLDMHSLELDHGALAREMVRLYDVAPPGGPFPRLATQLVAVAATDAEAELDDLRAGDQALARLVIAAREQGNPEVMLDAVGAPAGLGAVDEALRRRYLMPVDGGGANKIVRLRYRELRAGDIVQTADGPRPVDLVTAEMTVRVELAGEVILETSYRGASPPDAWRQCPPDTALRQHYRDVAVAELNEGLAKDFAEVRVP